MHIHRFAIMATSMIGVFVLAAAPLIAQSAGSRALPQRSYVLLRVPGMT